METIVASLEELSADPRAWVVAALVALKAAHAVVLRMMCPVMKGTAEITQEKIDEGKSYALKPTMSYLLIMLGGISLAVGGLYVLNGTDYQPLGLGMMVVGIFMFTTEPNRLFVRHAMMGVFATTGGDPDANIAARERLKGAHTERAIVEILIAAAVIALLYFF